MTRRPRVPIGYRLLAKADDVGSGGGQDVLHVSLGQAVVAAVA